MARIRTVKPELWTNERIAACSAEAVLTYIGLLTQSDDHGRHRDNAAIIAGVLWPLRAEHTPVHVEDDLTQLAEAGLICRYTGCDGRPYMHIVGWQEHQKIDKRGLSRVPVCTVHHPEERCGRCKGACVAVQARRTCDEPSGNARGTLGEGSPNLRGTLDPAPRTPATPPADLDGPGAGSRPAPAAHPAPETRPRGEFAGQESCAEPAASTRGGFGEGAVSGSRILDPGSVPTGREAPGAHALVAEYVRGCERRPPEDVLGHLGRIVKKLLAEGIAPEHVRAGLTRYGEIQGHPSRLASLVNDAMNAPRPKAGVGAGHRAWTNPDDPAAAYGEEL